MKPLTIKELKSLPVGDWVWVIIQQPNLEPMKGYWQKTKYTDSSVFLDGRYVKELFNYSDYGTKWVAYKNKEQAEGAIVLTKEEQEGSKTISDEDTLKFFMEHNTDIRKRTQEQVRKETAKEILSKISKYLKLFSHIHKYSEEAKNAEIEFADGEKGELQSVWDVITLHKNEQADYETMNQLEDNIGNIAKSRLLKEFEKDFKRFAEKYDVEVDE